MLQQTCKQQMPFADEDGWYDKFLCTKDWKVCDFKCATHHAKLDPELTTFVNALNQKEKM